MEFTLTPQQERFRQEVCAFFADERVRKEVEEARRDPPGREAGPLEVYRRLGERGWLAVNWPQEYGGLGRSLAEAAVVSEEMCLHGVPDLVHVLSIDIVGLFLLMAGTPQQKRRHLPPLARGEQTATVLYTEPEAGSDLAALTTRAEPDGGGWRLYGRKVYSQKSQFADFAICAARTSEAPVKYHGITLFLIPMKTPGVDVQPLWNLSNERFDDVTIDGLLVTASDALGPVDEGWQVINEVLSLERTGIDYQGRVRRWFGAVLERAAATGRLTDPAYAQRLVELDARIRAGRTLAWRVISKLERHELDDVASAMSKWLNTELAREVVRAGMDVEGLEGVLSSWDGEAPCGGLLEAVYRESPGQTISAGTSEVMLYVIAANGLRLYS